jgi:hypothetical protein
MKGWACWSAGRGGRQRLCVQQHRPPLECFVTKGPGRLVTPAVARTCTAISCPSGSIPASAAGCSRLLHGLILWPCGDEGVGVGGHACAAHVLLPAHQNLHAGASPAAASTPNASVQRALVIQRSALRGARRPCCWRCCCCCRLARQQHLTRTPMLLQRSCCCRKPAPGLPTPESWLAALTAA